MKVLASDFDGTLFFKGKFKEEDLKQIRAFQAQGHQFGLCTGRPLAGVTGAIRESVRCDFMILSSGAQILDGEGRTLYKACIDLETAAQVGRRFSRELDFYYQTEEGTYCQRRPEGKIPASASILTAIPYRPFTRLDELPADIYGLTLYAETDAHAQEIAAQINAQFPTLEAFQNEEWIDVARRGCSKGKGIELLKQQLSFKTIAGIGDSYNDIPLLRTTSPSFTFHSSPDAVKQEAQFLVDSLAEAIAVMMRMPEEKR